MDLQDKIIGKIGGYDKLAHFLTAGWLCSYMPVWYSAVLVALVIGIAKELIDRYIRKTKFDWRDVSVTVAGGAVSGIIKLILV